MSAWWRRKDGDPATPAPPAGEIRWAVDECFSLRGVWFLKGWALHTGGAPLRIGLEGPAGQRAWINAKPIDRHDLVPLLGPAGARAGFEGVVDADAFASAPPATLKIVFSAGGTEATAALAEPWRHAKTSDAFFRCEAAFWRDLGQRPAGRILEIGSRARSGLVRRHLVPDGFTYVGLDYLEGENVDVVADAHELSRHVPPESFDAVFSISTFEHLAMPWKVAVEMNQVMKTGAIAFLASHQTWPPHEQPWDFFRFSDRAWSALFNVATGFEVIDCGMGVPGITVPARYEPTMAALNLDATPGCLASCCYVRKLQPTALRWDVPLAAVAEGGYPH